MSESTVKHSTLHLLLHAFEEALHSSHMPAMLHGLHACYACMPAMLAMPAMPAMPAMLHGLLSSHALQTKRQQW